MKLMKMYYVVKGSTDETIGKGERIWLDNDRKVNSVFGILDDGTEDTFDFEVIPDEKYVVLDLNNRTIVCKKKKLEEVLAR